MMTKRIVFYCCVSLMFLGKVNAQVQNTQLTQTDESLTYVNGEGTFLHLGKSEGTTINVSTTLQSGIQYSQFADNTDTTKSNRMSLNLVRVALTAKGFKDKMTLGIVTDFTGVSPILEGWVGFAVKKNAKIILGQKQTNTNNRLAMADERYAQVMGQTQAGKSNDGTVYGGLMQNFVGATREGGIFIETNFKYKKWRMYPSLSLTTGEGQNFFSAQPNMGCKYGGRLDIMPLGDFTKNNAFIAQDIYRESKPKLVFGIAASVNAKSSSAIGSESGTITDIIYNDKSEATFANYRKIVMDFMYKYKGFAIVGEYVNGNVTGKDLYTNASKTNKFTEEMASRYYNTGTAINIQPSYVFKNGWSIDARYTSIMPEFDVAESLVHSQHWITGGINKYIKNNAVKIGVNISQITDDHNQANTTKTMVGNFAIQIIM